MISKIKEQLNIIDLIIDSVEENGGFTNLDKKAALDAIRYIYDSVLTAPAISSVAVEQKPDIEVSVYGMPDAENIEIELEKYETSHINDDCTFEINGRISDEEESVENVDNNTPEEEKDEDIVVEELYLNEEGEISEEKVELSFNKLEEISEDDESISSEIEIESLIEEETEVPEDAGFDVEQQQEQKTEISIEPKNSDESESTSEVEKNNINFVIGEIMDDDVESDETSIQFNDEKIVFSNDNELLYEDNDLNFNKDEKTQIINDLFDGDASLYSDFAIKIAQFKDFDEAILYLQETFAEKPNSESALEIIAEKLAVQLM